MRIIKLSGIILESWMVTNLEACALYYCEGQKRVVKYAGILPTGEIPFQSGQTTKQSITLWPIPLSCNYFHILACNR